MLGGAGRRAQAHLKCGTNSPPCGTAGRDGDVFCGTVPRNMRRLASIYIIIYRTSVIFGPAHAPALRANVSRLLENSTVTCDTDNRCAAVVARSASHNALHSSSNYICV